MGRLLLMKPTRFLLSLLSATVIGLFSACDLNFADRAPTPFPAEYFPTVVALTGQAAMATTLAETPKSIPGAPDLASVEPSSAPVDPSATFTATETNLPPSITPTETPTETPTPLPSARSAQIQFQAPGPMSKVTSPLHLRMLVVSGGSRLVQIDLQGEDGRLLARTLKRVPRETGGYYVSLKIPFEVRAAAELGRLTVSTKDEEGRLQSLAAEHVLLLSVGEPEITPAVDPAERLVLYSPSSNAVATGGILFIEGRYQPLNTQPVVLELLDPEGNTVGLRVLEFDGSDSQEFSTSIPYKISEPTEARLVIRQDDTRLAGLMYWYSQLVSLLP